MEEGKFEMEILLDNNEIVKLSMDEDVQDAIYDDIIDSIKRGSMTNMDGYDSLYMTINGVYISHINAKRIIGFIN